MTNYVGIINDSEMGRCDVRLYRTKRAAVDDLWNDFCLIRKEIEEVRELRARITKTAFVKDIFNNDRISLTSDKGLVINFEIHVFTD